MTGNDPYTALVRHHESSNPHPIASPRAALRTYFAALADRDNTPVDIVIGPADSISEGTGASTKAKRYQDLVRDGLRAKYQPVGVVGGDGYRPATVNDNNPWTFTGTTALSSDGLGLNGRTMNAAATATMTFTGTALDIFYAKQPAGGTLTVAVDGATSGTGFATINTANATKVNGSVVRVGGLTAGTHTVVVTCSSATSIFEGAMVYNGDEAKGIRVWNNAHYGYNTTDFTNALTAWTAAITAIQPQLVVHFLGTNDWRATTGGTTAAGAFAERVATIVAAIRAACTIPPSILIVIPYLPATGTNVGSWSFQVGMRALARIVHPVFNEVSLVSLQELMGGNAVQSNSLGLLQPDLTHPSDKGHRFIADALLTTLGGDGVAQQAEGPTMLASPLATLTTVSATAWPTAAAAFFQRITVAVGRTYRYVNLRIDTASGNYQVGVVRLSGSGRTSYARVLDSGVVAVPVAGDKHIDLGATYLPPGEYAIFVWADNISFTTRTSSNSMVSATRLSAGVASLATGVPLTGTLVWNSPYFLGGVTLEADV